MKQELFDELTASVGEGLEILRGRRRARRTFATDEVDVAAIRESYSLSQAKFAALLGISVKTLQNWEQGRREPHGPARVLLRVAARHPNVILDVVHRRVRSRR